MANGNAPIDWIEGLQDRITKLEKALKRIANPEEYDAELLHRIAKNALKGG